MNDTTNYSGGATRKPRPVTEAQAWAAWNKVQEEGENLSFESFWEILKESL